LRGGRYRLLELQERQDWLSGVFEAVWIGNDAHRAGSQVIICEVVLPENTSVMTQSILRTATMALVTVGRHPHIPGLWDAFSDQGRSFFVFEPIEGETLMGRMRYSGHALPEQEVIECCLQLTDVLELLSQQSPQLVHGLIRPEHIILSRNNFQYVLTNFSIVLAGGATQYIAGVERSRLSSYTAPEFVRGIVDVRTDIYSLIATAYHAVTGRAPVGISGSIPQAQRINPNVSSAFDAILSKGLRTVSNQRYQRPSELRQDLLAMRSVSGTLVSGQGSNSVLQNDSPPLASKIGQRTDLPTQHTADQVAQALPLLLNTNDDMEDRVLLLPKPEDLPLMKAGNDTMNAAILLSLILVVLVAIVILSQMMA
jgi:serine/threonine protein kinase